MTELERELLEALKGMVFRYGHRYKNDNDYQATLVAEAAILRAEAKAKEPQCKCETPDDCDEVCAEFRPESSQLCWCYVCGHDRACHIVGGEG